MSSAPLTAVVNATTELIVPAWSSCAAESQLRITPKCPSISLRDEYLGLVLRLADIPFKAVAIDKLGINGSITSYQDALHNGLIDMEMLPLSSISSHNASVSIPIPCPDHLTARSALAALSPKLNFWTSSLKLTRVYHIEVWFLIFAVACLTKLFTSLSKMWNEKVRNTPRQGGSLLAAALWTGCFVMIFSTLYQGRLLVNLLVKIKNPTFSNYNEMIDALRTKQLQLVVFWNYTKYQLSETEVGATFDENPPIIFRGRIIDEELLRGITEGKYLIIAPETMVEWYKERLFVCPGQMITLSLPELGKETIVYEYSANVVQKTMDRIDESIVLMTTRFIGIDIHNYRQSTHRWNTRKSDEMRARQEECDEWEISDFSKYKHVELKDLVGVFLVLLMGAFVALAAAIVEKVVAAFLHYIILLNFVNYFMEFIRSAQVGPAGPSA